MIRAYHGTKRKPEPEEFDASYIGTSGRLDYGHGVYFTSDPDIARRHGEVIPVNIDFKWDDFLDLDQPLRYQRSAVRGKLMTAIRLASAALLAAGIKGIRYTDYTGAGPATNYVVFDLDLVEKLK